MTARKNPTAAEALGESVPFDFDGVSYEIAPTLEWPFEVLEAYEENRSTAFLRGVLGPEQYDAFKATKPTVGTARNFAQALLAAVGAPGN